MLARTFRTHEELGLLKHEYEALVTTLYMIEDGQIPKELVYMPAFTERMNCGTAHCLAGWAHHINKDAFPQIGRNSSLENSISYHLRLRLPPALQRLFHVAGIGPRFPGAEAPARLRTYLETGTCG